MPSTRRSRRAALVATVLLPVVVLAACGGDDDSADVAKSDTGGTTTTAAGSGQPSGQAGGRGSGTFTIAGAEYAFEAEPCSIGGKADQPSVEAAGKGTFEGKEFKVVLKRSPSASSVIENVQIVFSLTESMVGTNFVGLPEGAANTKIKVEGDKATGTFTVLGSGGRPSGDGTITVTCAKS